MNLIKAGRLHSTGFDKEKTQHKINLWIVRVLMVAYAVFAAECIYKIVRGDQIVIKVITLVASLISIYVHYRVLRMIGEGQNHRAAVEMMVINFILLAVIQATDAGNSPLTGATYGLVSAVIASQMLSDRWSAVGIFLVFVGGSVIAVFDYLLPGVKGGIDFHSITLYLMLIIDVFFVYLLLRPFNSYQMNVKFLLAMTAMTITAVVATFASVYLVVYNCPDATHELMMNIQRVAVISGAVFVIISGGVSFLIARFISRPLVRMISNIQSISEKGDFSQTFDVRQQGEVSYLALALNEMNVYFKRLADVVGKVSDGDLTVSLSPRSERDLLGKSFVQMIDSLRQLVQLIIESAQNLSKASDHLNMVVENSNQTINTITLAVNQVLVSEVSQGDAASFKQLAAAIESIAQGAQDQARAVNQAADYSTQIGSFVGKVSENIQVVHERSQDTARNAQHGVEVMDQMVGQIENIRNRVGQSAGKVAEMGEQSKKIEEVVSLIGSIASQTNLLALNTAIEAARSSAHTAVMAENILDSTMTAQAWLVAHLLKNATHEMKSSAFWARLAKQCRLDEICVTDGDGVVVYSNMQGSIGFRLPDDAAKQAFEFRSLIGRQGAVLCQPLQKRDFDDKNYKYVGVSRIDEPGIVQIGFDGASIDRYKSGGGVFSVISEEILQLAKQTQLATKEIMDLNLNIQKTVHEAVASMVEGEQEVVSGVTHAGQARDALNTILNGTDSIQQQVEQAAVSVQQVEQCTRELADAMDSVSAVVEENTAATEQMAASTGEVTESIHMISALAMDMKVDMDEISQAVESLAGDVENAQDVVKKFKLL